MTMITPSYLGETIEYSSLHACRSTLEDPTFEATARIRAQEMQTGKHLPIIATTAYAMKGDRERCLASGMDGYVSKPMLAAELFQAIDETLTTLGLTSPASPSERGIVGKGLNGRGSGSEGPNGPAAQVFDQAASLERAGGNTQLLAEMAVLFAVECPKRLQEICVAIAQRDTAALERAAHTLRGSVSNFCAPAAVAAARTLETMGRTGVLAGAAAAYDALETAMQQLQPALAKLNQGTAAAAGAHAGSQRATGSGNRGSA